jgi:Fe2+ or Zn2+ uptake regulation protein
VTPPEAIALHDTVGFRLRAVGQRYTTKRRELVEALRRAGNPMSIPDVLAGRRALPQSSVYRNMGVLEHAGVVHRVITEGGFARFELSEDLSEHHHHVVCRSCGVVKDVTIPARLERSVEHALADVAEQTGFEGVSHRLDLIGTCRSCS